MPNFIVPSLLLLVAALLLLAACQDGPGYPGYSPVYIQPVGGGHDMYGWPEAAHNVHHTRQYDHVLTS